MAAMDSLREWWAQGQRVPLRVGEHERAIFVRRAGEGPPMTLLHGFPSSSHDWAKVAPALARTHTLLMLDFLGFGASEKPATHEYSLHEQADIVEAVWAHDGVTSTVLVAHDYAVSVTEELLARRAEDRLAVDLRRVHLLNGGLYPELHRPQPTQTALLDPEQGPQIGALLTEELFVQALRPSFADGYDVPLAFVWGMLDPISGAHMAQRIRERLPRAPLLALEDVSHWPLLEAPERVAAALLQARPG
jgi:pimeloyl-ACP methyl ester carboxylesterase